MTVFPLLQRDTSIPPTFIHWRSNIWMTHGCLQHVLVYQLSPRVLQTSREAHTHTHTLTTMDCLLWADVEVLCPTERADLIKTEETHHFIWRALLLGLTLIQWLLPALWLYGGVEGGEALCLMLTAPKQNNPPPRVVTADTPSWVVSGEVSKRIQLPAEVCSSVVD